jgi:hypothetical protein
MTETCGVDGCDETATLVNDSGASCDTHSCTVDGCDEHAVGETDGVPVCDVHMQLATADLLEHVQTWGDADSWGLQA